MQRRASSYEVTFNQGGRALTKTYYITYGKQPQFVARNVEAKDGARHALRPSALAYAQKLRLGRDVSRRHVCPTDGFDGNDAWAADDDMPDECREEDAGWLAGPPARVKPP